MDKRVAEWLKQADYDLDTADFMAKGGRYIYAVFMCHLAVEKALKGLYQQKLQETPPKTHNLIRLLERIGLVPDQDKGRAMTRLNEANVTTRYPDDIDRLQNVYTQETTAQILAQTRRVLEWIKTQF
jgi:HEPN domain-containing protein